MVKAFGTKRDMKQGMPSNMPSIYYQDQSCILYHGDCLDVLPSLKMEEHDLLFLDPPFDAWKMPGDVSCATTIAFTNWQNREKVNDLFGKPKTEVVWHFKDGRWVSHMLPRITHELILVYGKTGEAYVGPPQDTTPIDKGAGCVGKDTLDDRIYTPRPRKQLNSVIECARNVNHPLGCWGKPLSLVKTLLEWVDCSSLIDPFAGSGTSLLAAKELGMKAIGIEINEEHCEIAANRLSQDIFQF